MSRSYRGITPRTNLVYSKDEVCSLYGVHPNTLSNWVKNGLHPVDDRNPQVFRGAELARFHRDRRARQKKDLRLGEFKCLACKNAVFPELRDLYLPQKGGAAQVAHATCPDCCAVVHKILGETERDAIKKALETNTSLSPSDEGEAAFPAGIVKSESDLRRNWSSVNDRLIYEWQSYAGRYDRKTVDAHLISIRSFEAFFPGCTFETVTTGMAAAWRDDLVARVGKEEGQGGLSRSTVRHRASHMRAFFDWLAKRPGQKHLSGISDYLLLPRKFEVVGEAAKDKPFPSLQQAEAMLMALPTNTLKDRRDRAILALAFAAGLREGALISLRMRHVMADRRQINHDGSELKAKNGKSFTVDFFPKTETFQKVFLSWFEEMASLGLRPDDAVFPDAKGMSDRNRLVDLHGPALRPMRTASAVDAVFKKASAEIGETFTPHSARHTLAKLGEDLCRTAKERKAWSLNMGHENESITWQNYAKLSPKEKSEVLSLIDSNIAGNSDDMELLLDCICFNLSREPSVFERVQKLVEAHRQKLKARAAESDK